MNCTDIQSLYDEYKAGRLDPGRAGPLETHLEHCLACARQFREGDALGRLYRQLPRVEAPADFESLLKARLANPRAAARRKPVSRGQAILVAASAVLAMGLGFMFNLWRPVAPQPTAVLTPRPAPAPPEFVVPVAAAEPDPAAPRTIRYVTKDPKTGDDIYVELPASFTSKDMKTIQSRYLTEVSY